MRIHVDLEPTLTSGPGETEVEVDDGASLASLLTQLGVSERLGLSPREVMASGSWVLMVNDEVRTSLDQQLRDGDCVALFRFVPGG